MLIGLGSDHAGFELKEQIRKYFDGSKIKYKDFGTYTCERCDYVDFGVLVAEAVAKKKVDRGILFCGSGLGMSMVANKVKGIRAALCFEGYMAEMSRLHNDANILVLGGRITGIGLAKHIVDIWLKTKFEGGRHQDRLDKISKLERK